MLRALFCSVRDQVPRDSWAPRAARNAIQTSLEGTRATFSVNDTGIEIAEESLPLHAWAILSNGQSLAGRSEQCGAWIGISKSISWKGTAQTACEKRFSARKLFLFRLTACDGEQRQRQPRWPRGTEIPAQLAQRLCYRD
jgi:hypothetical protein